MSLAKLIYALVVVALLPTGTAASDLIEVVDTNGKVVGPVTGTTDTPAVSVSFTWKGSEYVLRAGKDGFLVRTHWGFGDLFYKSANCSGPKLVEVREKNHRDYEPFSPIGGPGKTIYKPAKKLPKLAALSADAADGSCREIVGAPKLDRWWETVPVVDLSTMFQPPFRLVAKGTSPIPEDILKAFEKK